MKIVSALLLTLFFSYISFLALGMPYCLLLSCPIAYFLGKCIE